MVRDLEFEQGNERRLTGHHETASISQFSYGVANRGASVRIGRDVEREGKGYFEDRRPSSNMDPYVVTSMIVKVRVLSFLRRLILYSNERTCIRRGERR